MFLFVSHTKIGADRVWKTAEIVFTVVSGAWVCLCVRACVYLCVCVSERSQCTEIAKTPLTFRL